MMIMKIYSRIPTGVLLAGATALILATAAAARADTETQETQESAQADMLTKTQDNVRIADKLGDRFTTFAGSEDNATALVTGLHDGTAIDLTSTTNGQTTTTTFTPTTGRMGYGNVFLSLALAEADLTKLGITQPTPEQIQAALDGGSVTTGTGSTATTTQLTGVLVLRNQGQGWGQVAQSLGVNMHTAIKDAHAGVDPNETAEAGQAGEMRAGVQGSARVTDKVGDHFTTFAGSEANATALVTGLHDGTAINLTSMVNGQATTTTFTPATGKMGFGNVFLSLALAEADLAKLGITQPTPDQIQAALDGGSVTTGSGSTATTTQLAGVLALRNQGQGWGQVAQSLGVNLGTAVSNARAGVDPNEAAEAAGKSMSASAAAAAHTDVASAAHPDVPAVATRPDIAVARRPDIRIPVHPQPVFVRPDIPARPMIPGHH